MGLKSLGKQHLQLSFKTHIMATKVFFQALNKMLVPRSQNMVWGAEVTRGVL